MLTRTMSGVSTRICCCSAGAEAADGAGVVPIFIMRSAHRRGDARRDLVADDNGAQKRFTRRAPRLGQSEGGGDGRGAGMVDAVSENVVHLDGMRGRAVD